MKTFTGILVSITTCLLAIATGSFLLAPASVVFTLVTIGTIKMRVKNKRYLR